MRIFVSRGPLGPARVGSLPSGRRPRTGRGQPARLVTFDALQERLGEPGLRLLDARPRADYDKGHIPGAVWVDAKAVGKMAAKPGVLADRAAWESWIAPLGIGPETDVLVYDANRQLDAARLWWLLGYLGVEKVGLLDGNFPLWAAQGRPVTAEVPKVEPRPFKVTFRDDRHATKEEVLSAIQLEVGAHRRRPEHGGVHRREEALEAGRARADGLQPRME